MLSARVATPCPGLIRALRSAMDAPRDWRITTTAVLFVLVTALTVWSFIIADSWEARFIPVMMFVILLLLTVQNLQALRSKRGRGE